MRKATLRALYASTVTSAHVDWLTLTASHDRGSDALWDVGNRLSTASEREGELPTAWHGHGYRGTSVNGIAYGARADGTYLRLSGLQSAKHWLEALTAAEHCTRLDLAVDTQFHLPVTTLVTELYLKSSHESRHGGRPPMKRLTMDTRGGQTLYFGARSSERFGRLYDKGVESKSQKAGRWWRWELESKESVARQLGAELLAAADPASFVQGVVAGFFHARAGVTIAQLERASFHKTVRDVPSSATLLHWLSIGVRPTVARLTKVYGRERVLHALGIPLRSAVDALNQRHEPEESQQWQPAATSTK